MKGIGNYRSIKPGPRPPTVERRIGRLLQYLGPKAVVRFEHAGATGTMGTYAMPAAPMREIGLEIGERFVIIVTRRGKSVLKVRVERAPKPRNATVVQSEPKVMTRNGKRLVTRK